MLPIFKPVLQLIAITIDGTDSTNYDADTCTDVFI